MEVQTRFWHLLCLYRQLPPLSFLSKKQGDGFEMDILVEFVREPGFCEYWDYEEIFVLLLDFADVLFEFFGSGGLNIY